MDSKVYDEQRAHIAITEQAPTRCAICNRRLGDAIHYLEETGDVPEPRRSWALCESCNDAVREQMRLAPVASDLRLRAAVGVVAAERSPTARSAAQRMTPGQLGDKRWESLIFWSFLIAMLAHLALIVFVAYIAR